MSELFKDFSPLSAKSKTRTERAPSALYSLGSVQTRKELRQLFTLLSTYKVPISPSLYHTIIEMPDGSKWQAIAHGKGHRWECVFADGDGYQDLFPSAA